MSEMLGFIGALLLGGCCLPQTIKTIKSNRADDLSWGFLMMWLIGELAMVAYVSLKQDIDWLLLGNYILNLGLLIPILYVKVLNETTKP